MKTIQKTEKYKKWFEYLGFEISYLGRMDVIIRAMNAELDEMDFKMFFEKFKNAIINSCDDLVNIMLDSLKINLLILSYEEQKEIFERVYKEMELIKVNNYSIPMDVDLCCNLLRNHKSVI